MGLLSFFGFGKRRGKKGKGNQSPKSQKPLIGGHRGIKRKPLIGGHRRTRRKPKIGGIRRLR